MGAIDNFLKRRGYAKLDRYGLVLTPDERVLSTRPAVLDDGLGGKIVGWADGDLATMELDRWAPAAMPAAAKTVAVTGRLQAPALPKAPSAQRPLPGVGPAATAAPVIAAPAAIPAPMMAAPAPMTSAPAPMMAVPAPMMAAPAPMMAAPAPMMAAPARVSAPAMTGPTTHAMKSVAAPVSAAPARMSAPAMTAPAEDDEADWERLRRPAIAASAPVVAAEPELTEDEWEWEIAMARVRAAADQVSESASAMQFTKPKAPAPRTLQMAAVAAPSASRSSAPRPFSQTATASTPPVPFATMATAPKPFAPMASAPKTMPMAAVAMGRPEPMPAWPKTEPLAESWEERTESTPPHVMSPVEKLAVAGARRSTVIPVPQLPVAAHPSDVRPPPSTRTISPRTRMARGTAREDTVLTRPAPGAHDENTSPYVTLPSEVRSPGYAHTKRAAAKHR